MHSIIRGRLQPRLPQLPIHRLKRTSPRNPHACTRRSQSSKAGESSGGSESPRRWIVYPTTLLALSGACFLAYEYNQPVRHVTLAAVRCSRVAKAAILGAIDYKLTFAKQYDSDEALQNAYSACHKRSAERVLKELLANGGIFIKLGQHIASLVVLPKEWTSTMRPLQDQCDPTPYEDIEKLFLSDMGRPISEIFEEFDPQPLGVASLAQVHKGRLKETGEVVAVKVQHPHLQEFCDIDMEMVEVSLGWIKHWFPDFEFTWLGEEMRENLPKEMDFVHERNNARRAEEDFADVRTSLYIPQVRLARKRILVMEYIQGGRVDDLPFLADNNIDRNKVAIELARIFSRMVHLNGWFHADPHPGNLLIRPARRESKSPYNFEIVLLDHGLYFDLDPELRVNYSKLWLSLILPASPETQAERRKYAKLVGNIDDDLYPVFEAAITGRAALEGSWDDVDSPSGGPRATSLIEISSQTEQELEAIRNAVVQREGLLLSVFDVLRRVPRRVLMVLKLNDLTRSLDHALMTTHSSVRVFLIMAKYCSRAVWEDQRARLFSAMREKGLMSISLLCNYFSGWWRYQKMDKSLRLTELWMDWTASMVQMKAWVWGLFAVGGLEGAHKAAAGLA